MSNYDAATFADLDFDKADITVCDSEPNAMTILEAMASESAPTDALPQNGLQALAEAAALEGQKTVAPSPAFSRTTDDGLSPMRPSVTRKVPPSPAVDAENSVQRWLKKAKEDTLLAPDHPSINPAAKPPATMSHKSSRMRAGTRASMLPRPVVPLTAGRDIFGPADPLDWPTPAEMSDSAKTITTKSRPPMQPQTNSGTAQKTYKLLPPPAGTAASHRKAPSTSSGNQLGAHQPSGRRDVRAVFLHDGGTDHIAKSRLLY
ncbi:hypothetical protein AURDEDRAFT_177510 [Auricularia subglabra TFB-10046 SS5]|uniref:Uncharacterized protein n=1 Tax=Auricularia subglabra (strain TFB-10046 / SS5) TaxID=717982 RepID=J0D3Y6_AURST|nr:hypothetical protein AURDEDRAFT_177510 [Auricularia subglabra TFB-10046 SS5]